MEISQATSKEKSPAFALFALFLTFKVTISFMHKTQGGCFDDLTSQRKLLTQPFYIPLNLCAPN